MNQLDSAKISINRALEFDPLDRATNAALASLLIQEKRFDEAVRHCNKPLTWIPTISLLISHWVTPTGHWGEKRRPLLNSS